jgi:hypothetical protein
MKNSATIFCVNLYPVFPRNGWFEYGDLKKMKLLYTLIHLNLLLFQRNLFWWKINYFLLLVDENLLDLNNIFTGKAWFHINGYVKAQNNKF